jgi:uncharacterized alkaline shock family protein YloU
MSKNQKTAEIEEENDISSIPTITEESTSLGDIKINHSVVASIVRLATLEVDGVISVGSGSFVDGFAGIFPKKEAQGVRVGEDEAGAYLIEIRVVLKFGVELAKTACMVQERVRDQIIKMTSKAVSKIDVIIDEVRLEDTSDLDEDAWANDATD